MNIDYYVNTQLIIKTNDILQRFISHSLSRNNLMYQGTLNMKLMYYRRVYEA